MSRPGLPQEPVRQIQ
uniref:Nudix hydrolase 7 n=1 Tax=Nomascus leucogenys TaxID=61853 RepID=A0A2I3HSR7_NOMLE